MPGALWLIGLGNLGQAYLWALAALPYRDPSELSLVLQDRDKVSEENWGTSVRVQKDRYEALKTKVGESWADAKGFNVRRIDRYLHAGDQLDDGDPRSYKSEFSPLDHPKIYRQEFLNSVVLFMTLMPLVEQGLVNLFPDPCNFDLHLRDQMLGMAKFRSRGTKIDLKGEAGLTELMREDCMRSMLLMPREAFRRQVLRNSPELDAISVEAVLQGFDALREQDSLVVLQEGSLEGGKDGGQFIHQKMVPNFEITMYLAQATGSCIVTDSTYRWRELNRATGFGIREASPLTRLRVSIEDAKFFLPYDALEIVKLADNGVFRSYPNIMRRVFKYLLAFPAKTTKPNVEANLNAEFRRGHASTMVAAMKFGAQLSEARLLCLWPAGGVQDNSVNRLLLMSSSEYHLASVPMALFVKG